MDINFFDKHGTKLLVVFLILTGILAAWLLYQRYLKPQYELTQLLPNNHQISFEYKSDRFSLPKLQQQKMLNNPALSAVYGELEKNISYELEKFSPEALEIADKFQHSILFYQSPEKFGLIFKIPNKQTLEKIKNTDFANLNKKIVKEQILALSNDAELLKQMVSQKISTKKNQYLSVTISPWLTIRLQNSFFQENYTNPILNTLQQVLLPLQYNGTNSYIIEVDTDSLAVSLSIKPRSKNNNNNPINLENYLDFIQANPSFVLGISDLENFKWQLSNNSSLKQLWQKFDSNLWISNQVSLSSSLNNLKPPILISEIDSNWQILTSIENKDILESYLKAYLAQFSPKETLKILPDGTPATELIADPSIINWQEGQIGSWQTFFYPEINPDLGLAIKDNLLIFTNSIGNLNLKRFDPSCSPSGKKIQFTSVESLFYLKPTANLIKTGGLLNNFSKISLFSNSDSQIKACLGF